MSEMHSMHPPPKKKSQLSLTVHCRLWVVYPQYHVADWELRPTATRHVNSLEKYKNTKFDL
jgi:hypothetical protein